MRVRSDHAGVLTWPAGVGLRAPYWEGLGSGGDAELLGPGQPRTSAAGAKL